VTLCERDGKVSFDGTLIGKSKETADKAKSVVEGARAMAELHHGQDAAAMKLIKALKTTVADKTLTVEFASPVDELWAQAEKAIQKAIEHRKNQAENKSSQ
jgi:hypothetical protein